MKVAVAPMPDVHPQMMQKTQGDDWMSHDINGRLILNVKDNKFPAGDNVECSYLWWFGMKQQIYEPENHARDGEKYNKYCYCGGWWQDQENGKGTLSYSNGCTFVGNFTKGHREA